METVLLTWQASEEEQALVRQLLPDGVVVVAPPHRFGIDPTGAFLPDLLRLAPDATALMGWSAPPALIAAAARLRCIAYFHHGVDDLPLEVLRERGIQLANAGGVYAVPLAEEAMAFLLACSRRVVPNHRALTEARWQPLWDPTSVSVELDDKTVVIVGFGTIGRLIGVRCKAFGMRVIAVRRRELGGEGVADVVRSPADLPTALEDARFVILTAPLTAETYGLFDDSMLRNMRADAYLINVGRAHLVDEVALYQALVEGRLAGYASDVWWDHSEMWPTDQHYPVPSRLGVHRMDSVVGNGDRGANTLEAKDRVVRTGAQSVAAFLSGGQPLHVVDLNAGY